jgi:outer membrane protein OmpA-like peptidoglycan-associated protein
MPMSIRTAGVCAIAMLSLSACATKGALRRGLEEERLARASADSTQQAGLAAQQTELAAQKAELASLRSDVTALRTEFGAKISEVAEGIKFAFPVHFAYDDASVRPSDTAALERFATVVQKHYPGAKVTVEGFADPAGSASYNLALSRRRAEAVREFISMRGVDTSLVNVVGYGETRLVNRGAARDMPGAELNRRVVFVIETPANDVRTVAVTGQ